MNREPPSDMELVRQLTVGNCYTLCHYKGLLYVGLEGGTVDRIEEQGQITKSFIKLSRDIITIRAHNDQLFILMLGQPGVACYSVLQYKVYVYDLTGTQISSWDHGDNFAFFVGNKLVFMESNLLVADVAHMRITAYTTAGDTVRHIPCPAISTDTPTAMCAGGDDCVIVSQNYPSLVSKFNLTSGTIEWTSDKTPRPLCVEYSPPVVLVSGDSSAKTRVWILDYNTGDTLRELSDEGTVDSFVFDMCVFDNRLLILRYQEKSLLYYKLNY